MSYQSSDGLRIGRLGTGPLIPVAGATGPLNPAVVAQVLPAVTTAAPPVMPTGLLQALSGTNHAYAVELLQDATRHYKRAERLFREVLDALQAMGEAAENEGGDTVLAWNPPAITWFDADAELAAVEARRVAIGRANQSRVILGSLGQAMPVLGGV